MGGELDGHLRSVQSQDGYYIYYYQSPTHTAPTRQRANDLPGRDSRRFQTVSPFVPRS